MATTILGTETRTTTRTVDERYASKKMIYWVVAAVVLFGGILLYSALNSDTLSGTESGTVISSPSTTPDSGRPTGPDSNAFGTTPIIDSENNQQTDVPVVPGEEVNTEPATDSQ